MNQPMAAIEVLGMGSYTRGTRLDKQSPVRSLFPPGDKKDLNRRPLTEFALGLKRRKTRGVCIFPLDIGLRSDIAGFQRRRTGRDNMAGIAIKPTPQYIKGHRFLFA